MLLLINEMSTVLNMTRLDRLYPKAVRDEHSYQTNWKLHIHYKDEDGRDIEHIMDFEGNNTTLIRKVIQGILKQVTQIDNARATTELENALRSTDNAERSNSN